MNLLDRVASKTVLGMLWLLVKEVRRLAHAVEQGVDTFRAVHGHRPIFHQQPAQESTTPVEDRTIPRFESAEPDWLRLDLLEALCREHHIAITDGLDLFQVGREMGWIGEDGQFTTLPTHYGE